MEEIYFKEEARKKLISGINKLCDAVSTTMGPNGKTVIIPSKEKYGEYIITKDGVSVAETIFLKDPIENIGAQLLKEAAINTAKIAGDGTTTATVLATSFINNLKDFEHSEILKSFDEIIPKIINELKKNSKILEKSDIKHVASISANNDMEIGNNIQQAFNFSNIVKVEKSTLNKDKIELVEGAKIQSTYFSNLFVTDKSKNECYFENCKVLLLDGKLNNLALFEKDIKYCANNQIPLLIIAEDVSETVLHLLETNVINNALQCCVIKSPGFGNHRKNLLKTLSLITNATLINDFNKNKISTPILGDLKSVKIDNQFTILEKNNSINVSDEIEKLLLLLNNDEILEYDKKLLQEQYDVLNGKIAVIKVGANSELELKERFDRYDDAVKAVQCALEEGIVEGGGIALIDVCNKMQWIQTNEIDWTIKQCLLSPAYTICNNKGIEFNKQNIIPNMFKQNIIDPLKVTRTALENAVSIAKTILTTDCVVLNKSEWN